MAMIGRARVLLSRLLRRLKLTTSTSMPQVFTRRLTTIVGSLSPSAVW